MKFYRSGHEGSIRFISSEPQNKPMTYGDKSIQVICVLQQHLHLALLNFYTYLYVPS